MESESLLVFSYEIPLAEFVPDSLETMGEGLKFKSSRAFGLVFEGSPSAAAGLKPVAMGISHVLNFFGLDLLLGCSVKPNDNSVLYESESLNFLSRFLGRGILSVSSYLSGYVLNHSASKIF